MDVWVEVFIAIEEQHDCARVVYVHPIVEDGDDAGIASLRAQKRSEKHCWLVLRELIAKRY